MASSESCRSGPTVFNLEEDKSGFSRTRVKSPFSRFVDPFFIVVYLVCVQ